jgi:hypothetical protein
MVDGRPYQRVHAAPALFPLATIDLRDLSSPDAEREILRIATEQAARPLDLFAGPLLRAVLVRVAEEEYRLLMTVHLSIVDGLSIYEILPSELSQLYTAFQLGQPSPLPSLPIQYADYAYWERHRPAAEIEQDLQYWRLTLAPEIVPLRWPDKACSARTHRGEIQQFRMPDQALYAAEQSCKSEGLTLFACLQAALVAVLYGYTAQRRIRIGTFSSVGRKRSEVRGLLGHFLNPVTLSFDVDEDISFSELMRLAQRVTSGAISHDGISFDTLARELLPGLDVDQTPLFSIGMSLQPRTPHLPGWEVTTMDASNGGSFWDLYIAFIERRHGIIGRAQYNPDCFDKRDIEQLIRDLTNVLTGMHSSHLRLRDVATLLRYSDASA